MRFLNFVLKAGEAARLGMHLGDGIVDVAAAMRKLPLPFDPRRGKIDMISLIKMWAKAPVDALQPMREIGKQPAALFKDVTYARSDLHRILPPLSPSKNVFCVGQNYKKHIEEMSRARGVEVKFPKKPTFFTKPPTSVIGDGDVISFDRSVTQRVDYEVELAIVIGRTTKNVSTAEAMDSVFGYTIVNDVSARDLQEAHGQFFKGKALDTFCPMGPCIVTADEFGSPDQGRRLTTTVNGAVRQDSTTSDLLFSCAEIVASLSQGMTLEAGDVIATGTPSGVAQGMTPPAWLRHGDVVEVSVEGVGSMRNTVREEVSLASCRRVDLTKVAFAEKDTVKALGARWDAAAKKWYLEGDVYRADRGQFVGYFPFPNQEHGTVDPYPNRKL